MKKIIHPPLAAWSELCLRSLESFDSLEKSVKPILRAVKRTGDKAVRRYMYKFDKIKLNEFLVSPQEFDEANAFVGEELKRAIQAAKYNIAQFHMAQKQNPKKIETTEGIQCWQKSVPIEKVGLYIPSRNAPLFSTIMMLGIPANIAGCNEIVLCSRPNEEGKLHPIILYTANLLNIRKVYKIGGVQAIAAMAYGTESIPKVYKIFGPSNEYVTAAKMMVGKSEVAIDLPTGPSELVVFADETCQVKFVAADLLCNAELGRNSQTVLITTSEVLADTILKEMQEQLKLSTKKSFVEQSWENAKVIVFPDNAAALKFINEYAPENLVLAIANEEAVAEKIINAGSVHLGNYSPETAGHYGSGINHTLPTNANAKAYSGVSVDSFVKKINFQKISEKGMKHVGERLLVMAEAEELPGRRNAVKIRMDTLQSKTAE